MNETPRNKILFVDDEIPFLDSIRRVLKNKSDIWDIDCVERGVDALLATARTDYDVIVTDITMPGMSGFELLSRLREADRTRDTPVIVLTGNAEHNLKREALDLGATDLLTKPVHPADLISRLGSALRIKECQDHIKEHNRTLELKVQERTAELEASRLEIIWRLAKAAEFRDEETGNHVIRVGCYCRILSEKMNMPRDFTETLFLASPLHDIGKIGIPDSILLKPQDLTPEERRVMEKHCEYGAEILLGRPHGLMIYSGRQDPDRMTAGLSDHNPVIEMAARIALHHHERWDGTGYPHRIKNTGIPISARIVSLADVYDALSSKRPYKDALEPDQAFRIICEGSGTQFDPEICRTFEENIDEIRSVQEELSG
ncbi:MAG: response regulator [Deltaproteobacteria bacterium]|nr:response regulator [Deltaproteobacteria bacterium]